MRTIEQLKDDVCKAIDARRDEIINLGRYVWKNPEPGYREVKTSAIAIEHLRKLGMNPQTGLSITGFRADLKGARPGPTVAILGEMDSLIMPSHPACDPTTGAAHACGHHSHITAMVGTAMALVDAGVAPELAGNIAFIGCPAEEAIECNFREDLMKTQAVHALGGKASLIFDGVFDDVDMAIMNHLGALGNYGASDHNGFCMKIATFKGHATHAASPGASCNALSAANLTLHALGLLREKFATEPSVRMHGIITDGGNSVNIIPDCVKLEYQLRGNKLEIIEKLSDAFDKAVNGCAAALECTADIVTFAGYCPCKNDEDLCKLYNNVVKELVPDATPHAGAGFSSGSTDMGDLSVIMPSIHSTCPGATGGGHTVDFTVVDEEKAYVENTKILAMMAIELLYGNADLAREIAQKKKNCMSIADYKATMNKFNTYKQP